MKKCFVIILCFLLVTVFVSCSNYTDKVSYSISFPNSADVDSVNIITKDKTTILTDSTWISELLSDISDSKTRTKESVQDVPYQGDYMKIEFVFIDSTRLHQVLFAYEENGKYYIEEPYQGKMEIAYGVYKRLESIM